MALRMWIERLLSGVIVVLAVMTGKAALDPPPAPPPTLPVAALQLTTTPVALDRDDPARDRIGALRFLGAVQIRSTNPGFGGVSALRAGPASSESRAGGGDSRLRAEGPDSRLRAEGAVRLLGINDTGNWLAFDTIERDGRLVGVANGVMTPIRQPDGGAAATKDTGDAEGLEWDPATGIATISYEQEHRLVHFTGIDAAVPASLDRLPAWTERLTATIGWPANGGAEAIAVLSGGARIILAEDPRRPDGSQVALLTRNGETREIGVEGVDDFSPTDAVAIDDHRILVLHRRFSLMVQAAALTLVDLAPALGPNPPATLPATLLARWQPPLAVDNMEGLAIRHVGGRTFVYIMSDDNLNSVQRTLLMKFEISPVARATSTRTAGHR